MTDIRKQCDEFAAANSGCKDCQGNAFDLTCESTIGPVSYAFTSVLDPCNDDVRLKFTAEGLGVDPVDIDFKYVAGASLSTSNTFSEEVTEGVTAQVDIATTVFNPKANTIAAVATADICLTIDKSKLPDEIKSLLDTAVGFACFLGPSSALCKISTGKKVCGAELSGLLSTPAVKGAIESALKSELGTSFSIPDFTLPITLPEQSVSYSCENGVTKILQGSAATVAAPLIIVQTLLAGVTAMAAFFRL